MTDADSSARDDFIGGLGFQPDRFQLDGFQAVDDGHHAVVAAPTGAGKTVVAEYLIDQRLGQGLRVFYTTPIKALSNQKYHDLVAAHGAGSVGLLTGDNTINGDAPVVVMTTEVLRNMLYAGTSIDRLAAVVLDEVHYLQDAYRGPVWEEVIIHLPRSVQLVCLSATVSNADELASWIETVRGPTDLVVETQRPVELTSQYLVGERGGNHLHLMKTLQGNRPNPKGFRYDNDPRGGGGGGGGGRGRNRGGGKGKRPRPRKWRTPDRVGVVELLARRDLLPAIHFIFSRAACDDAARSVLASGMALTNAAERERIAAIIDRHTRSLDRRDLDVLEFHWFRAALEAGVAAHHAGMVPPFKEAVEACFVEGLVKVVFATETLALGINMPARTVVVEKLTKFTGERHEFLTPAQFTQLTGRAGRRGIDTNGDAVVLWSPYVRFEQVAELAGSRRFTLTSSFRPTYNMAANLVRRYRPERARQLLNLSFAQFRSDAGVVRSEQRVEKVRARLTQHRGRLERDYGPIEELRAAARTPEVDDRDEQAVAFALSRVGPGDVISVDAPNVPSPVAVISLAFRRHGRIRARVVDERGQTYELTPPDLLEPPEQVGGVELPEPYLPDSVTFAFEVGENLKRSGLSDRRGRSLAPSGTATSQATLDPKAVKGLRRLDRLEQDLERALRSTRGGGDSLGARFDRVIELLERRGHLVDWELTGSGERLARLYHEQDLLVVETLEAGLFDDLPVPELVALASTFVYEERRGDRPEPDPWYPSAEVRRRVRRILAAHLDLAADEDDLRLPQTRVPDPGFLAVAHGWASGGGLDDVLSDEVFTAGDFVRTAKQLIDLLRQLGKLAPSPATAAVARQGADAVHRDLVAASSAIEGGGADDDGDDGATDPGADPDDGAGDAASAGVAS
ncbi:MAG: DEAD/DEAH box helicase [Actinomycetota bacterium]